MGTKIKSFAFKSLCVVLCWALIVVPGCFLVRYDFLKDNGDVNAINVPGLSGNCDNVATILPEISVEEDLPEEDLFGNSDVVATEPADKNLLSYKPMAPTDAAGKAPQPVVPTPTPTPPASNGNQPTTDIKPDTGVNGNGSAGFYGDYALLTQTDGSKFIYYDQTWDAYASYRYGNQTIGGYGCGPTSMAMVISNLTGTIIKPTTMGDWSYANGFFVSGRGTAYGLFPAASAKYGITCTTMSAYDKEGIVSALKQGKLLLTVVGYGDFTRGRHFLLIRGITDDGKLLLADSGRYENCLSEWDYNRVIRQVSGGMFWVFE